MAHIWMSRVTSIWMGGVAFGVWCDASVAGIRGAARMLSMSHEWVMVQTWIESCQTRDEVMSHICMGAEPCESGWRTCKGYLKLQVTFRKRATNYRALLWKMTCKDKASYASWPPCTMWTGHSLHELSHVARVHKSLRTCAWAKISQLVVSHIWMSHVAYLNQACRVCDWCDRVCDWSVLRVHEPCHTYERVMSHVWLSHVTHLNRPCHKCAWSMSHTYQGAMSHIWMRLAAHTNEPRSTYEWVMSHIWQGSVARLIINRAGRHSTVKVRRILPA